MIFSNIDNKRHKAILVLGKNPGETNPLSTNAGNSKNFHIYIHGNNELIRQGVDSDGRKYYKIYFETES
jgi:hypothetical protein